MIPATAQRIHTSDGSLCMSAVTDVPLDSQWQMAFAHAQEDPEVAPRPASDWVDAAVPGTVADALRADGRFSWDAELDLDGHGFLYRTRFKREVPAEQQVILNCLGLATIATAWLNGTVILRSANMFRSTHVEISSLLRRAAGAGTNDEHELVIYFAPLRDVLEQRQPRARWRTNFATHRNLRYQRTSLLGRTPGIGPMVPVVGPWRPVILRTVRQTAISDLSMNVNVADGAGNVSARMVVRHAPGHMFEHRLALSVGKHTAQFVPAEANGDSTVLECTVQIPDPELWWPHTHGEPVLYPARVHGSLDDTQVSYDLEAVGFRTIEFRDPFEIVVNDTPIFCRGLCWMPADLLSMNTSEQALRAILERLRSAGLNMLRISGDTAYESDVFYALCDELGIMVWQDFMFARFDYPVQDDAFRADIRGEAMFQLQRLAHRPCLTVLCGNSEVQQTAAMLGMPRDVLPSDWFDEELPQLCAQTRPDVAYVCSSPSGGAMPFHPREGVSHFFGLGAYMRHYREAQLSPPRFASECLAFAHPSSNTHEMLKSHDRVPKDRGAAYDFLDVTQHYVQALFGASPETLADMSPQRQAHVCSAALTRLTQEALAAWRWPESACKGALLWTAKDLWPSPGWGVMDADGHPKAAFHGIRRACEPIALALLDQGLDGLSVACFNDTDKPVRGQLALSCLRLDGTVIARGETEIACDRRSSQSLSVDQVLDAFVDSSYAYRFGPPQIDLVVAELSASDGEHEISRMTSYLRPDLGLLPAQPLGLEITCARGDAGLKQLELRSTFFAQAIEVDAPGCEVLQNHFDLPPGVTVRVDIRPANDTRRVAGLVRALNGEAPTAFEFPG